jgi:putative hydrolase of HD superfamily
MAERLSDFVNDINSLKRKDRAGWVKRGIQNPESVAEHSFGTGWLAFALAARFGLDANRCAMLGFVHDFAEARVPDYMPSDKITAEEKFKQEESAMIDISRQIPNGDQILALWYEVEREETPEGEFVKRVDKLEMMFQANSYGIEQPEVDLSEFWGYGDKIDFKEAAEIYKGLRNSKRK